MKKTIVLIFVIGLFACGQTSKTETPTQPPSNSKAEEVQKPAQMENTPEMLEQKGIVLYQESPEKALPIFKELIGLYQENNNTLRASFSALSVASIYADNLNKPDSALIYAHEARNMWEKKNDGREVANVLKYIGILESQTGKYDDAIAHINEAIGLYKIAEFQDGIAVAQLNLAEVHFAKKDIKKGEDYLKQSTDFWRENKQDNQVFNNNLAAIKWYGDIGNKKMVKKLIKENSKISAQTEINALMKSKFNAIIKEHDIM